MAIIFPPPHKKKKMKVGDYVTDNEDAAQCVFLYDGHEYSVVVYRKDGELGCRVFLGGLPRERGYPGARRPVTVNDEALAAVGSLSVATRHVPLTNDYYRYCIGKVAQCRDRPWTRLSALMLMDDPPPVLEHTLVILELPERGAEKRVRDKNKESDELMVSALARLPVVIVGRVREYTFGYRE
jgi:hypothetical protein